MVHRHRTPVLLRVPRATNIVSKGDWKRLPCPPLASVVVMAQQGGIGSSRNVAVPPRFDEYSEKLHVVEVDLAIFFGKRIDPLPLLRGMRPVL